MGSSETAAAMPRAAAPAISAPAGTNVRRREREDADGCIMQVPSDYIGVGKGPSSVLERGPPPRKHRDGEPAS